MSRGVRRAFFLLIFSFAIFSLPKSVFADTLFLSPASGTYTEGQTFSVRIMVSSQTQAINAVSATLSFPTDKLKVTSISKIGSILNLWVAEPSYSNSDGTVSMEGVVPNPGFSGSSGQVLTINFRAIDTGTANLKFTTGQILANDGYGTNVLSNKGTASFLINAAPAQQEVVSPPVVETPVQQVTHPVVVPQEKTLSISIPSWSDIYNWLIKFLSLAIPLFALLFLFFHTTKKGVANLRAVRRDVHNIDRMVEKSFDIFKDDITQSIRMLEKVRSKRSLTREEDAIIHRLRQNLGDAERVIHQEVLRAEKDLGD